jgi:hypothetical protein
VYQRATDWKARVRFPAGLNFMSSIGSRPALGTTHSPIQWVQETVSPGVKRQEREADHSPPSSVEVKKGGAILPMCLAGVIRN